MEFGGRPEVHFTAGRKVKKAVLGRTAFGQAVCQLSDATHPSHDGVDLQGMADLSDATHPSHDGVDLHSMTDRQSQLISGLAAAKAVQ